MGLIVLIDPTLIVPSRLTASPEKLVESEDGTKPPGDREDVGRETVETLGRRETQT